MAIGQTEPVNIVYGNNLATKFDYDFYIETEEQLVVEHINFSGATTLLTYGVDYSIDGIGNEDGGQINFPLQGSTYQTLGWNESTDEKERLVISLCLPFEQAAEFDISGDLNKKNLEKALDYQMRCTQILKRQIERSVQVPEGSAATPTELIASINEAQIKAQSFAQVAEQKAKEANNSAAKAEEQANIAIQKVAEVSELHDKAISDITEKQANAVLNIQQELQTAEDSIIESKNIALENIESTKTSSILEINNSANTTKTDILNQLNSGKETAISEIQKVSDAEKVNLQSYVDKAKASENIATSKASEASTSAQKALASENVCTAKEQSVIQKTTEALNRISTAQTTAVSAVNSAKTSAVNSVNSFVDKAQIWADGTDEEVQSIGGVHSAKGWAEASAQGQIQADWKQTDTFAKDYIRNKPNNLLDKDLTQISEAGKKAIRNTVSGFNLLDTKEVDHILTGDEAVGWALQGSLITNTYPDAVAKIKELYQAGEETTYREITCKRSQDGRYIADIAQKDAIEVLFTNTGIADFYVLDSSNNQFYLPKSKWFNQLTTDTSFVNNYNEDGLPNLKKDATGSSNMSVWSSGHNVEAWEGLIGRYPTISKYSPNSGNYGQFQELLFDASKYNSKYGNSEYVQPPSSNKLLYYKVGNTIINEAQIDVGNVLSDLQLKANVDFNNITNKANTKIQDSSRKMLLLTNNYIDIAVGQILTADADGYATINYDNMHDNAQIAAYVFTPDGKIGIGNQHTAGANTNCQGAIFVPKGNKYKVWANGGSLKYARFYFCETYQGGS